MNFYPRTSIVDYLSIYSASQAAILHIGDSQQIRSRNNVIAIQQVPADFEEDLYVFNDFEIFHRPEPNTPIVSDTNMQNMHVFPTIKVHRVYITGAAGASIVHIGSTETIQTDTRIKHIRDFRTYAEIAAQNEEKKKEKDNKICHP